MAALLKEAPHVELVTVHRPVPKVGGFASTVVNPRAIEDYYSQEGGKSLAPAQALLDEAKIAYTPHILIGEVAQMIVEHAEKSGCQIIYLGTRGLSAMSSLLLGSVATK